jgi:hypothetical protein
MIYERKFDTLSFSSSFGIEYREMISVTSILAIFLASWFGTAKASDHFVKWSIMTTKTLLPFSVAGKEQ